jgi:molybdopterin-biosynthesis enzyme MoeA-like protein
MAESLTAKKLFHLGIDLKRIQVIKDDQEEIAETVRDLSKKYDLVFTSGGIGKNLESRFHCSNANY